MGINEKGGNLYHPRCLTRERADKTRTFWLAQRFQHKLLRHRNLTRQH
jgi:hypothetical protein